LDNEKTKEYQYSILIHNGNASELINTDLNNYDNKLLEEIAAGTPARKAVRPIPEMEFTENAAANADEQTTKENEGSLENANANKEKKTPEEKKGAALIKASKIQELPEGKKPLDQRRHLYPRINLCMSCLNLAMKKKTNCTQIPRND
jgi:hypothetical protein